MYIVKYTSKKQSAFKKKSINKLWKIQTKKHVKEQLRFQMKNNFVITNQIVDKKHTKLNKTYNDRIKYKFYKID